MRTTIDIPDPLFREVKATAARKGVLLKQFITAALIREVAEEAHGTSAAEHQQKVSEFLRGIQAHNTAPVPALNRDELHERSWRVSRQTVAGASRSVADLRIPLVVPAPRSSAAFEPLR